MATDGRFPDFWRQYNKLTTEYEFPRPPRKITKENGVTYGAGKTNCKIGVYVSFPEFRASEEQGPFYGVALVLQGERADEIHRALRKDRRQIDRELGADLPDWDFAEPGQKWRVVNCRRHVSDAAFSDWKPIIHWLILTAERFLEVFPDRLRAL